jgi:hypothetical protein
MPLIPKQELFMLSHGVFIKIAIEKNHVSKFLCALAPLSLLHRVYCIQIEAELRTIKGDRHDDEDDSNKKRCVKYHASNIFTW